MYCSVKKEKNQKRPKKKKKPKKKKEKMLNREQIHPDPKSRKQSMKPSTATLSFLSRLAEEKALRRDMPKFATMDEFGQWFFKMFTEEQKKQLKVLKTKHKHEIFKIKQEHEKKLNELEQNEIQIAVEISQRCQKLIEEATQAVEEQLTQCAQRRLSLAKYEQIIREDLARKSRAQVEEERLKMKRNQPIDPVRKRR